MFALLVPYKELTIFHSKLCSTTGVTKAVLSCLWDGANKIFLAANRKEYPIKWQWVFSSCYLNVLSVSLNKTFPSFFHSIRNFTFVLCPCFVYIFAIIPSKNLPFQCTNCRTPKLIDGSSDRSFTGWTH